jgi:hypothetical protein
MRFMVLKSSPANTRTEWALRGAGPVTFSLAAVRAARAARGHALASSSSSRAVNQPVGAPLGGTPGHLPRGAVSTGVEGAGFRR